MPVYVPNTYFWFSICFAKMLVTLFFMSRQSLQLYYLEGLKKKFSAFNLEFPAKGRSISELVNKIRALSESEQGTVFKTLGDNYKFIFFYVNYLYEYAISMHSGSLSPLRLASTILFDPFLAAIFYLGPGYHIGPFSARADQTAWSAIDVFLWRLPAIGNIQMGIILHWFLLSLTIILYYACGH